MEEKRQIFQITLTAVRAAVAKDFLQIENPLLQAYEFNILGLTCTLQTDFDNHLETLIEYDGHTYSNGGDYMPKIADWNTWSRDTLASIKQITEDKELIKEVWQKRSRYVGGLMTVHTKSRQKIIFSDINNNFLPILKIKKSFTITLK